MRKYLLLRVPILFTICIIAIHVQAQNFEIAKIPTTKVSSVQIKPAFATIIKGTVSDESGAGISGVTVSIRGSGTGTATDAKGSYSITVPDERLNDSLLFSSVGYEEQHVAINGRIVINVVLVQDVSTLTRWWWWVTEHSDARQ